MDKHSEAATEPSTRGSSRARRRGQSQQLDEAGALAEARDDAGPGTNAAATERRGDRGRRNRGTTKGSRADDGGLVMRDQSGDVVHTAVPAITESLRYLLARLRLRDAEPIPQVLGVISSVSGEGVTFVARSLALVLANDYDKAVCLLDTNWGDHADLDGPGLAGVLGDRAQLAEAIVHTDHPRLDLLPAGTATLSQRPVFAQSPALAATIEVLRTQYDHVIVDLVAASKSSEGLMIAGLLDAVAVVVRQGVTAEGQVRDTVGQLGTTRLLGVILNAVNTRTPKMLLRRILSW